MRSREYMAPKAEKIATPYRNDAPNQAMGFNNAMSIGGDMGGTPANEGSFFEEEEPSSLHSISLWEE
ncbi:MAG: hypothetical protein IKX22_02410 [Prevotella sp.]|nr:hypothetical protein [Prevotella sp.]